MESSGGQGFCYDRKNRTIFLRQALSKERGVLCLYRLNRSTLANRVDLIKRWLELSRAGRMLCCSITRCLAAGV